MNANAKLHFLIHWLVKRQSKLDAEVLEILKLKFTQHPFATLSIFTMIQVDS